MCTHKNVVVNLFVCTCFLKRLSFAFLQIRGSMSDKTVRISFETYLMRFNYQLESCTAGRASAVYNCALLTAISTHLFSQSIPIGVPLASRKGRSLIASDARNWSCHGSQRELLAFLACLEVSAGSGEGSGINNGGVNISVCAGSSEGEARGVGSLGSSPDSHCQAGEGSFVEQHVLLRVVGISNEDG